MEKRKKKIAVIFLAILVSLLIAEEALLFKFSKEKSLVVQLQKKWLYSSAIEQGVKFYTPEKMENMKIDDFFLMKEVYTQLNKPLPANLEENYAADPFRRIWDWNNYAQGIKFYLKDASETDGQPINNSFYFINEPNDKFLRDPWDDVMLKSLYCDQAEYTDYDFSILKSIGKGDGRYWDTHFLLGLIFLEKNKCYDSDKIEEQKGKALSDIISAARKDKIFSDLYAERIVFLYWAGQGGKIKKEWTDVIRDNLTKDPGWRTGQAFSSNAHTTGLSLLSLIYFREGKEVQSF